MAGIGFELKKIYRKEGISRSLLGAAYSSLVTIGPMIIVIAVILVMYAVLGTSSVGFADRELLSSTILYVFIFSVILTAPFNSVFSRYLADKIYAEETQHILPSYYTGLLCCSAIATAAAIPVLLSLRFRGGVGLPYILAAYVLWISCVILFFSVTYLHATKDYKVIALFFLIGMLLAFGLAVLFWKLCGVEVIHAILYGLAIGFFAIAFLQFSYIKRYFRTSSNAYTECLAYIWKYKTLFLANFFYMLGLYVHNFIFWTTDMRLHVANTFYTHQAYDMATCLAMFTNISTMVIFTVMAETRFHDSYQHYMESVTGGTYRLIEKNKNIMFRTLSQQIGQVFGIQIAITAVIYLIVIIFFPTLGFSGMTMKIYPVLAVSYLGIFMMYGNIIYLYYFNDLGGSLFTCVLFFAGTFVGTLFSQNWSIPYYGAGSLIGMLCGFSFSFFRIRYLERNFEAHIFCNYKIIDTMNSSHKGKVVYRRENAQK